MPQVIKVVYGRAKVIAHANADDGSFEQAIASTPNDFGVYYDRSVFR